jgi:DNA-binding NtrC family response regulator
MTEGPSSLSRVVFVEDDRDVQKAAVLLLGRHGFEVRPASTPEQAWSLLAAEPVDLVLLDLNFRPGAVSGAEGLDFLKELIAHDPDATVVVVTGHSGINIAVSAMRAGATDFVMKPWNNDRLVATLRDAVARRRERQQRGGGAEPAPGLEAKLIGTCAAMRQVQVLAARVAATDAAVLLLGEAGTGKSLLAHVIHRRSARGARALATLDLAALWSDGEAALAAALEAVDCTGTLYLDEIGGLPLALQARLAAWLERHEAVRLIAGSRHDHAALQRGLVGADLLDRLSTVQITLPPLRDRGEDVRALAEHFLRVFARRHGRGDLALADAAAAAIASAPWPGNVRELRHAIERAVVLAGGGVLEVEDVLPALGSIGSDAPPAPGETDLNLARAERAVVQAALRRHGFNVSRAAKELGLTRATLYRRMARHGF